MSTRDLKGEKVIIWPSYFLGESRSKGRRFPKGLKPSIDEIISVCRELGLEPEFAREKWYPRSRRYKGAIAVKKVKSKRNTLKLILNELMKKN